MRSTPSPGDGGGEPLAGSVVSVVYRNETNGYCVLRVLRDGAAGSVRDREATVVGRVQAVWEGEDIRAEGRWISDKVHGRQFKADRIVCVAPRSILGIERYLASGLIRGIGKVLAKRIVETFGDRTLDVLEHQSARLREVPKLGPAKIRQIREQWRLNATMRENMIFGQTYGISVNQMTKIVRRYGPDAVAVIKADPYALCRDIRGIGFATADRIAMSTGIPAQSPLRARAVLAWTLETEAEESGHCWTGESDLVLRANELSGVEAEILAAALAGEIAAGRLVAEGSSPRRIYLASLYRAECRVAAAVRRLARAPLAFRPLDAVRALDWWQRRAGFSLAVQQSDALRRSLEHKVSVITGGPGVGKTTIVRALAELYARRGLKVVLAAPTGRAARRMAESVGMGAQTIHRLLKWNPATGRFTCDAANPYPGDVFVFDETSMIDVRLAADTLEAVPDGAAVVWVGDTDQLPSVGPGAVLGDLIRSSLVASSRLTQIFRQDSRGLIVVNAHHVNAGEPLEVRSGDSDFYFVRCEDPAKCLERTVEFMTRRIPEKFGLDPLADIQVLTPMRRNLLGVDSLNAALQQALNPGGVALVRGAVSFRAGDRIMQLRNNYDKDVYNGDIGFVKSVDADGRSLVALFDGRVVVYEAAELDELSLAYATTVHKSQGSEYPAVIVLMHTQHYVMLQRNLLYTAITRGRRLVLLVGVPYAVERAIANNAVRERRTTLAGRIDAPGPIEGATHGK